MQVAYYFSTEIEIYVETLPLHSHFEYKAVINSSTPYPVFAEIKAISNTFSEANPNNFILFKRIFLIRDSKNLSSFGNKSILLPITKIGALYPNMSANPGHMEHGKSKRSTIITTKAFRFLIVFKTLE